MNGYSSDSHEGRRQRKQAKTSHEFATCTKSAFDKCPTRCSQSDSQPASRKRWRGDDQHQVLRLSQYPITAPSETNKQTKQNKTKQNKTKQFAVLDPNKRVPSSSVIQHHCWLWSLGWLADKMLFFLYVQEKQ